MYVGVETNTLYKWFISYLRASKSSEGSIWLDISLTTVTSHVNLGYIVSVVSKEHTSKIGNVLNFDQNIYKSVHKALAEAKESYYLFYLSRV